MSKGGGGGDNSAQKEANRIARQQMEEQKAREAQRRAALSQGTAAIDAAFAPFDDNFYGSQRTAYTSNYMPELDRQFQDAQKQLIYGLSSAGQLNSTLATDKQRRLSEERAGYERQINSKADDFVRSNRANQEATRTNLLSQLTATEDPSQVTAAAAREAGFLNQPVQYDPVSDFVFRTLEGLSSGANRATGGAGLVSALKSPQSLVKSPTGYGSAREVGA